MTNSSMSISEFEYFVYGITDQYPEITVSTLVFKRLGRTIGELSGEIKFTKDIKLKIFERIDFSDDMIEAYGYEVYRGENLLYWYDPQPHPNDPLLTSTFPHHKHIHPDIKHHRVPAPGLGFSITNLAFLIEEIITNFINS